MAENCSCGQGLGNTGIPNCAPKLGYLSGFYLVETSNANRVSITETIDDAFILDKINESDTSLRWYPLLNIDNVENVRAESVYNTTPYGQKRFVKKGVRNVKFRCYEGGIALMKNLESNKCTQFSVYEVDNSGAKLIGVVKGDGYLTPIKIAKGTIDTNYFRNDGNSTDEYVEISFDWAFTENDTDLGFLNVEEGVDLNSYMGLKSVVSTVTSISQTGFTIKLNTEYGAENGKGLVDSLVTGDFALYNVTDSSAVTVSTFAETSEGVYALTFASQTVADKIRVTVTKDDYDFSKVTASLVTIA